ncbi:MAG: hypothetical protein WKF84_09195 [Pyrinomonadaceae bacterium]
MYINLDGDVRCGGVRSEIERIRLVDRAAQPIWHMETGVGLRPFMSVLALLHGR